MLASFLVLQWEEKALPAKSLKGYQKETWPKAINQWIMGIILNSTWPEQKYESNIWLNFFSSEVSFFMAQVVMITHKKPVQNNIKKTSY